MLRWSALLSRQLHPLNPGQSNEGTTGTTGTNAADCAIGLSRAELDINNVRARYLNAGDMFWDPGLSLAKYEVPKRTDNLTSSKNSIFAAAIWLGGTERETGNVLVMVQTYRGQLRNYWPGPFSTPTTLLQFRQIRRYVPPGISTLSVTEEQ